MTAPTASQTTNSPAMIPASYREPRWYEKFWMVSILTLTLAIVLFSVYVHTKDSQNLSVQYSSHIFKESAFACLVAFFLNLSVEWVNTRRHSDHERELVEMLDAKHRQRQEELLHRLELEHTSRTQALLGDMFKAVYQRYIHAGAFLVIDNHILKRDIMRRNYQVAITIRPLSPQDPLLEKMVRLTFHIMYEIVNVTEREINTLILPAMIDIEPEHEEHCRFISAGVGNMSYENAALDEFTVHDKVNSIATLSISGTIPPRGSAPVSLHYEKVAPNNYSEVICTTVPMDGLALDVMVFDDALDFHAISLHPEDQDDHSIGDRPEAKTWRINHAILPGQGAVVFWHPKRRLRA